MIEDALNDDPTPYDAYTLLDEVPAAILILDDGNHCRFVNNRAERLFQRRRADVVGLLPVCLMEPAAATRLVDQLASIPDEREEASFEWATGGRTYVIEARRLTDGWMIVVRSAAADPIHRAIFEQSPIGIAVYDRDLRVVDCNDALASITGTTRDRIVGRAIDDLRDQRHRAPVLQALEGTSATYYSPYRTTEADRWIWATATFAPLRRDDNGVSDALVLVTARAPRHPPVQPTPCEEARQAAGPLVGIGAWTWDIERGIVSMTPELERMLGVAETDAQAAASRLATLIHPEDRDEFFERVDEALTGHVSGSVHELRVACADGSVRAIAVRWQAQHAPEGNLVAAWGTVQDVTELRTLQEQLRQSQRMEALGRLAGGVAHDFNNLLTVIKVEAEMLSENVPDSEELREIQIAADRAAGLTRQLLAFSRKQPPRLRAVDLNTVVLEASQMLHRLIGADVTLEPVLAPSPLMVLADRGQLEQVLMNLAINARDAMPTGGVLSIRTTLDGTHDDRVVLLVSDTGHGMTADVQQHIFEPFFTTKAPGVGTGLGLSNVFGIVKQSGGHVSVASEPGEGATFRVELPHYSGPDVCPEISCDVVGADGVPGGAATVLLVEDEPTLRGAVRRILERRGYTVLAAADGYEALEVAEAYAAPIDLLLTDVVLPRINGRDLYSHLRARRIGLGVLYMSGYREEKMLRLGPSVQETSVLEKPFSTTELLAAVRCAILTTSRE